MRLSCQERELLFVFALVFGVVKIVIFLVEQAVLRAAERIAKALEMNDLALS